MSIDPITLLTIGLSAAGSLLEGVSAYSQGQYQAQVADMNAKIAMENASRAIDRSQVEQQAQDAQTQAQLGELDAEQGASGLSLGGRSFQAVQKNARTLGRLDALNVRQAGDLEAYNYKTDAANFRAEAAGARQAAGFSLLGSVIGAGSSLVSGAGRTNSAVAKRVAPMEPWAAPLPRPRPRSLVY